MAYSKNGDMRPENRFQIECRVTAVIQSRGKSRELQGTLQEIWEGGARAYLDRPLAAGTRLILYVHLPHPNEKLTTIRFAGTVARSGDQPKHEIVLQLQGKYKFLTEGSEGERGIKSRVTSA